MVYWINIGRHGVNIVTGSLYTVVRNSLIENNGYFYEKNTLGNGIMIQNNENFGTGYSIIENNVIIGNAGSGIRLFDVVGDTVRDNVIDGSLACISAENTINMTLSDNECIIDRPVVIKGFHTGIVINNQPTSQPLPI
jgi:hypothetical protein